MTMDDRSPEDLAAAYALGALEPAEARAFENALAQSEALQREVAEYREVGALLAQGVGGAAPAPSLRSRVAERIARENRSVVPLRVRGGHRAAWPWWLALAATVAVAVGLGIQAFRLSGQLTEREQAIARLEQTLSTTEARLAQREATLNAILERGVELATLVSASNPEPGIQLFLNRQKGVAIIHASNLQPAARGRAYQLWFIPRSGAPIPSVVFNSEPDGHALVQQVEVPANLDLAAAAVTDEPDTGSSAPTTTPLLVGAIGS